MSRPCRVRSSSSSSALTCWADRRSEEARPMRPSPAAQLAKQSAGRRSSLERHGALAGQENSGMERPQNGRARKFSAHIRTAANLKIACRANPDVRFWRQRLTAARTRDVREWHKADLVKGHRTSLFDVSSNKDLLFFGGEQLG